MGLDPTNLPPSFRRRMALDGGTAPSPAPAVPSKADKRREKEFQYDCACECSQRNLFFVRSRMDKKTTLPKGMPDLFIFFPGGRAIAVEAKVAGGVISDDQKARFAEFKAKTGQPVHVVYNLTDFCSLLDTFV